MTEETLFAAALGKADPADRAAFLAAECPDPEARRRVEDLLAAHDAAGSFLNLPAVGGEPTSVLPPSDPDVTRTQAPTDPDATAAPHTARPADPDEALAFLKPSDRPGALGRLDHYEVLEVVGSGGFGTVLKAFDTRLHRVVAVKVLAPQLAASGAARARFLREARTAAAVRDEHVVNVFAVSDDATPVPYLVMEFVAGQTLQQKLDKVGTLPPKEVLRIGMQTARGLAAAHTQGLIHRDIKPANVLLENGVERVKITDFGLARAADDASISQSGVVAGTPMYMSPEQARGDALDTRSDLFSLGSVLYALCTGRPPFRADTTLAVLKRVVEDDPRPVRDVNPEVPRWLADVVAKLHAKAPADRFQTAKEVAELLAGYLAELQQQGTVVSRVAPPPRKRSPLRVVGRAAAVVAFLAVIGVGLAWWKGWVNGLVRDREGPPQAAWALLSVKLADRAVGYRVDGLGLVRNGDQKFVQHRVEAGDHFVWFRLGDRRFRTANFPVAGGGQPIVELAVTADGGTARLNGQPLAVAPDSSRSPASPDVVATRRDAVRAKEQERDAAKARYDAGLIGEHDHRAAELGLAEARANLAEAQDEGCAAASEEYVRAARAWRAAVAARVDAGVEPRDALARADTRVAAARAYLAYAGGTEPPAALPSTPPPAVAPFDAAQAKAHQEAWAKHLGVPVEFAHPSGLAFRLIPPGEFGMGFTAAELTAVRSSLQALPNVGAYQRFAAESSGPRHTVRITRPFYLARYETTAGQFRRFVEAAKHTPTGTIDWQSFVTPGQEDKQPVLGVSWADADAFCRRLGPGYELPSEAQWEYAARGGAPGLWSFGNDPTKLLDHAVFGQAWPKPGPVGLKAPNPFGLFDVNGGADEWCRDWHVADFYRRSPIDDPVNVEDPTDPATGRASRGGSWNAAAVYTQPAFRSFDHPTRPVMPKGFRVALTGDLKAAVDASRGPTPARPEVPFDALDPAKIPPEERMPWLPPGTVAVIGSHRGAKYDARGQLELGPDKRPVAPPADPVTDRYFCPVVDGDRVITFLGGPEARSWSVRDGAFHPDGVTFRRPGSAPSLSPGGRLLAGYQPTSQLSVLDRVGDRFELRTVLGKGTSVPGEQVVQYAWHPNGTSLVAANTDNTVDLWDLSPGRRAKRPLGSFPGRAVPGSYPQFGVLAISPDGKMLAVGNAVYDLTGPALKGRDLPTFEKDVPYMAVFTPAGRLVVGYASKAVRVFDPADPGNKTEVLCQPGEGGVAFWLSPDGRRLLLVGPHPRMLLWDLTTRQLVLTLTRTEPYFSLAHVSWADDSRHFVWGQNGVIYVIRVPDPPAVAAPRAKD